MPLEIWLAFVGVALGFLCTPGPSHLLMLSNSLTYGARPALSTAAGDLSANTLQMLAAGLGLAALITQAPAVFLVIKFAGVAYLVFLGLKLIFNGKPLTAGDKPVVKRSALYRQGFFTSATNPKAVVFFAALFPQFLSADLPLEPQLAALTVTYLVLDGSFLLAYGFGADAISRKLKANQMRWLNPISGVFIIIAAALLAYKSVET